MNDLLGIGHSLNAKARYSLKSSRPLICQTPGTSRFESSDCLLIKDKGASVKLGSRLGHAGFLVLSLGAYEKHLEIYW